MVENKMRKTTKKSGQKQSVSKQPRTKKGAKKLSAFSINRMLSALRSYIKFLIDLLIFMRNAFV